MTIDFTKELAAPMELLQAQRLAELLQALGDPTRLQILSALGTACVPVGAIVAATRLPQPAISHHLRILRDRGLVISERRGPFVYYCTASDAVATAISATTALLAPELLPQ